jgi:hypothetical protein
MDMKKPRGMKMPPAMAPAMPSASAGMPRFGARAMRPGGMAKGGKVPEKEWEASKMDMKQDKKLAAKRGMSYEAWEKSPADKKHDAQQSMKGLKKGGMTKMAAGGGVEIKGKTKGRFI